MSAAAATATATATAAAAAIASAFTPEALAAKALEKLGADAPTADSILRVAAYLAELVNKAPGLRGSEKAALVQRVLRDIVAMPAVRAKLSDDAATALNIVIDTVVPTALTLIISAGRGELDLKNPQAVASSFLAWCCRSVSVVAAASAPPKAADTATEATAPAPAPPVVAEEVRVEEAAPAAAASSAPTESSATLPPAPPAQ